MSEVKTKTTEFHWLKHRVVTDGELFAVETMAPDGTWKIERELVIWSFGCFDRIAAHKTIAKAEKWIRRKYGERAIIETRKWKPL